MKWNKEKCQDLAKRNAMISLEDVIVENGKAKKVLVWRRVVGCYGSKRGKDRECGVELNEPLNDGCRHVSYGFIREVFN